MYIRLLMGSVLLVVKVTNLRERVASQNDSFALHTSLNTIFF